MKTIDELAREAGGRLEQLDDQSTKPAAWSFDQNALERFAAVLRPQRVYVVSGYQHDYPAILGIYTSYEAALAAHPDPYRSIQSYDLKP